MKTTNNEPPGLYVHVPFCLSKCLYCDFYSITHTDLSSAWCRALLKEALLYKNQSSPFDTLYLGGGTPTLLSERELADLLEGLFRQFRFTGDPEITIEANPNDIERGKLRILKGLNVNRISLGIQSMEDKDLTFLARRHTARQVIEAVDIIRSEGFENLGIDLIYGLPDQNKAGWEKILQQVVAFQPEHISCYQLTVGKGTPLGKLKEAGRFTPAGEETERRLFLTASRFLEAHGYVHYEISNFARRRNTESSGKDSSLKTHAAPLSQEHFDTLTKKFYTCRHNLKYWKRVPYLGLGPSAHSFRENLRWWNLRSVKRYCQALARDQRPVKGYERLTKDQKTLENLCLGLRTKRGIAIKALGDSSKTRHILPGLVNDGLVEVVHNKIIPTRRGFLVADRLPLLFM